MPDPMPEPCMEEEHAQGWPDKAKATLEELGSVWAWVEATRDRLALADPMEPDYEALARRPITSSYRDSRDAAGIL